MIRWVGRAIAAWFTTRADLIAENLCLRQQLIVLQRRTPRPRLRAGDRRFWILACRWVSRWRESLLVIQPAAVLGCIAGDGRPTGAGGPDGERVVGGPASRGSCELSSGG